MTTKADIIALCNQGIPALYLSQDELDETGHLLDKLEDLEVYFNAPSISEQERQDTWTEMESVMERVSMYAERA